ncbi:S-layer homology domain-containing protein [Brevibacillus sp. NRS-1366]|uniref:S-layer homology domain-containing protein n=1 Tax=Brevibacillus sp. NRS-1366 TaxID=3233899 RepID=UPI003D20231D
MKKMLILASLVAITIMGTPVAEAKDNTDTAAPYSDIAGHWAEKEIEKCYIAGVVGRTEEFRPDDAVTRIELLTMFVKAKGIEPVETKHSSFADIPASI